MTGLIRFTAAMDRVARILMAAAALLLLAMVVLINVEVSGRYLFGFSTLISDEYSGYLFCWIVMFGLLHVSRSGRLLRVDAILRRTPPATRRGLEIANAVLGAVMCGILTYAVWRTFWLSWLFQTASAYVSETRLYLVQFVMPLGFGLLTAAFVELAVRKMLRIGAASADATGEDGRQ